MPVGAKIIHVGNQNNYVCIWAEVNSGNPCETRCFEIQLTGQPLGGDGEDTYRAYLGTVLLNKDTFVAHVYERLVKE